MIFEQTIRNLTSESTKRRVGRNYLENTLSNKRLEDCIPRKKTYFGDK
jgi:hypothetical protein